jgi:hypothetical protein
MEAVLSSETSVSIYQTPWHHISEDIYFQNHRCDNMKPQFMSTCVRYVSTFVSGGKRIDPTPNNGYKDMARPSGYMLRLYLKIGLPCALG